MLVREHPLRERLRAALMQALYGSGRQAEALEVYRETRRLLVDQLGIEPSPALQELEQAILRHDPALASQEAPALPRQRAIMVVTPTRGGSTTCSRSPYRSLDGLRVSSSWPGSCATAVSWRPRAPRSPNAGTLSRSKASRRASPRTPRPSRALDAVRLASEHDVDLVLLDAGAELLESGHPDEELEVVLERAPCDVAVLVGSGGMTSGPIVTPFGGVEHDWSAIEVAAWLAQSLATTLRLLGTEADPAVERRDASRLLSRASMLVQQVVGIVAEPVLVRPGEEGVLEAARDARLLVVGLSDRWRTEGIGHARLASPSAPTCRRSSCDAASGPRRRPEPDDDPLHLDAGIRADPAPAMGRAPVAAGVVRHEQAPVHAAACARRRTRCRARAPAPRCRNRPPDAPRAARYPVVAAVTGDVQRAARLPDQAEAVVRHRHPDGVAVRRDPALRRGLRPIW